MDWFCHCTESLMDKIEHKKGPDSMESDPLYFVTC